MTDYMRKEWRTDNRPVPMDEAKLDKLLKDQAAAMRKAHSVECRYLTKEDICQQHRARFHPELIK